MSSPSNHDWMISRSSVDVLEDYYEQFYHEIDQASETEVSWMQEILTTQQQVEKNARQALGQSVIELDDEEEFPAMNAVWMSQSDMGSLREALQEQVAGSPMYQATIGWSLEVVRWTRQLAKVKPAHRVHAFQAGMHAAVVPSKLRFAEEEEQLDDDLSLDFANIEYDLAHRYLTQATDALGHLAISLQEARDLRQNAKRLARQVQQALERVATKRTIRKKRSL